MESPPGSGAAESKSWSIYGRKEITQKYEIQERIGSGAYSDVYKACRRSDGVTVALKEVHDCQSAFREIEALQTLQNCPNVIFLLEYFWREDDDDAVLVLEYLPFDLASVITEAKSRWEGGLTVAEIKRWMIQILHGVDTCHRSSIVHRDLKPSNLLISADGFLKLADFGQARILLDPGFVASADDLQQKPNARNSNQEDNFQPPAVVSDNVSPEGPLNQEQGFRGKEQLLIDLREHEAVNSVTEEIDKDSNILDGDASCAATGTMSEEEEGDQLMDSHTYEAEEDEDRGGPLTSCVGTRWFRAPELLYGSTNYGMEVDLWSLGCIFAELFSLEPLFPGTSDIDQLGRIIAVLGNLTEDVWPGFSNVPGYNTISFSQIENPKGIESCLPNRSLDEINIVKKLVCYDPAGRATAMELLGEKYLNDEPRPSPVSKLRVPSTRHKQDEEYPGNWCDYRDMDSDSDFEDFGSVNVTETRGGFSIRFD